MAKTTTPKKRHVATLKFDGNCYYIGSFDDNCNNAHFKFYSKGSVNKLFSLKWYDKFTVLNNGKISGTCNGVKVMLQIKVDVVILEAWF